MTTKHTPGPWKRYGVMVLKDQSHINTCIATCPYNQPEDDWFDGIDWDTAEANAHLITASPAMLAALEAFDSVIVQHNLLSTATEEERKATISRAIDWWNYTALPAINEAKGETS